MAQKCKPMKHRTQIDVDLSFLGLEPGHYISITTPDGLAVEIVHKRDGTLQVCVDDKTFESGIHRFKDIYGPDPFKKEK